MSMEFDDLLDEILTRAEARAEMWPYGEEPEGDEEDEVQK